MAFAGQSVSKSGSGMGSVFNPIPFLYHWGAYGAFQQFHPQMPLPSTREFHSSPFPSSLSTREEQRRRITILSLQSRRFPVLLIMVSPLSNSSGFMGCPDEYSWARDPRWDPAEEEIRQGLDDAAMDDPPDCPHVANMQDIAHRLRDRVAGLEAEISHQHHNTSNVEATNEGLFHRLSSFSDDNRQLKKDLAEARALAAGSAADAAEYKGGLFIVGWLLIMAVAHILFVKTDL